MSRNQKVKKCPAKTCKPPAPRKDVLKSSGAGGGLNNKIFLLEDRFNGPLLDGMLLLKSVVKGAIGGEEEDHLVNQVLPCIASIAPQLSPDQTLSPFHPTSETVGFFPDTLLS